MRIIFFGADRWFSGPVLAAILKAGHQVPVIVTKGDALGEGRRTKDEGRRKIRFIQANDSNDISLDSLAHAFSLQPSAFSLSKPDAIVLASFGPPFLPAEVLRWPKYGCLNVHASLLPRWRGASPVFAALSAGDKETGVSIMRMTEEVDRGPVLGWKKTMIFQPSSGLWVVGCGSSREGEGEKNSSPSSFPDSQLITHNSQLALYDTRETLTKRLGLLGGELIVETLKKLEKGQITETPQPQKSPTPYTRRLTKDSGRIDWSKSPIETCPERSRRIERFIRAVTPWPGAYTNGRWTMDDGRWQEIKNIKILKAHLEGVRDFREFSRFSRESNKVENNLMLVIDLIQLAGKNPVTWKQFLAGHPEAELG